MSCITVGLQDLLQGWLYLYVIKSVHDLKHCYITFADKNTTSYIWSVFNSVVINVEVVKF
jgi:hypothetical protein